MKSAPLAAGALAIALTFGTGGYFLGKSQSPASSGDSSGTQSSGRAGRSHAAAERPALPSVDPVVLRAKLDAETNPIKRLNMAIDHLEAWIARNPKDALAWLASQEPSERRDDIIREALNQFSEIDAGAAADWALANLTGADLNNTLILIAEGWAEQDGNEAAAWFLGRPASEERDAALESLFFTWATNHPAAAMEFLKQNPGAADLDSDLLRAALAGWAKSEPEAAVAASLSLSRASGDPGQFANTLANWATMDLEASSAWLIKNVPAGDERTAAAREIAGIYANHSPQVGVAWLNQLSAGAERDGAAGVFAANWSRRSPGQAAEWIASLSGANLAPEAVATVARNFMMKNIAAFEAWRAALPPGPVKEAASEVGAVSEEDD